MEMEKYLLYYRRNVYGVPSCPVLLEWRENPTPGPGWEVVAVCIPKPKSMLEAQAAKIAALELLKEKEG